MQLDFLLTPFKRGSQIKEVLQIGSKAVPIRFIRNRQARRYIIRIRPDGSIRATVPRVGSIKEARAFAERSADWILKQLQKRQDQPVHPTTWQTGTEILYRGEKVPLTVNPQANGPVVQFGDQMFPAPHSLNLRPAIERHLRKLATSELPARTLTLAQRHGLTVNRVTIRNQSSRWGSCSRRGTVSLNWRLIQMPEFVANYIIIHELMHLREMNHSHRFWREVATVCANYREAKVWIRQHRGLLR